MRTWVITPRIWMKLAAIALSFMIPLVVTTYFLVNEENIKIDFAQQELRGDRYLQPVSQLLIHLESHRALVREGNTEQAGRTESLVDQDFAALLAVDRDLGGVLQTTGEALNARKRGSAIPSRLRAAWEGVKLAGDPGSAERMHTALIADVRLLTSHVGDSSKLILDPDLDTYYAMDALLLKEPEIIDELGNLGALVDGKAGSAKGGADAATLAASAALLTYQADGLKTDLQTAFAETVHFNKNHDLEPALSPQLNRAMDTTKTVIDATSVSVDPAGYASAVREAIDAHNGLWTELFKQEDVMLRSRRSGDLARRKFALTTVFLVLVAAVALTLWVARRISRNVGAVSDAAGHLAGGDLGSRAAVRSRDEVGAMATSFNAMAESLDSLVSQVIAASEAVSSSATQLRSAADELAATTTEQSAAVTEASATTEELARASASIADTVDGVAAQAAETRSNLEQAEGDIDASAERTVALADRVSEIGAILALINEIADQTNLLALNAAIEAARAGEGGRGFAVVADEVRRLAERSKSSAAGIAEIVEGIQEETNATVMAMEKGAKQMQSGLGLLAAVADGTAQVRLTTQQQRSATSQVVETMEQLADTSRQVSATANQIATASATLAALAANLERTGASAAADAP
ncbi:MAG: methyl-accepting chemotaxis protein [Actinomycetota bacterium]|jgi:methyl-accepting chemotaxis protein